MASRKPAEARRPAPRIYLVTPQAADPDGLKDALAGAIGAADLLCLAAADDRSLINRVKALAPVAQEKGAALMLDGHPEIVARAGADGAHLAGIDAFTAALATLKPARIAGCGALATRHDAMLAAQAGADYVMFGEPDRSGRRPSFEAITERVAWWAEVFEVPCVGFAAALEEVGPLAAAGADFVALGDWAMRDAHACAEAGRRLAVVETAA
jgi:thiamine-phosphate pyrophosphorylase